jgi:DNA-binding transcriptional regulator GbsR (MarR family)
MIGAVYDNNAWQKKIDELQEKLEKAQLESKDANEKINKEVENKKEKIVQKQVVVKQYIDREVTKYDSTCVIPKELINAHNQSAEDMRK